MTKISQIHDYLGTLVSSTVSGYVKLPNPYFALDNTEPFLKRGFGIAVNPGVRTDRNINCHHTWQRDFSIILTNQITTTDNNTSSRETIVKSMLEDHYLIFRALEHNTTLEGLCIQSKVQSDTGIQFLEGKTGRFFLMEIDVITEYQENFT